VALSLGVQGVNYRRNASWVLRIRPWSPHALLLALLSLVVSTALRMILAEWGATLFFATYFPAVLIVAVFAGSPAAVLVTALTSLFAWWAYFPPAFEFSHLSGTDIANLTTFWLSAGLIIWLSHVYRQTVATLLDADGARELLIGELNHRTGNTLAVMQAIVSGTVASESDRRTLIDRLEALARANQMICETPNGYVSLSALIRDETAPYVTPDRLLVEGPQVHLEGETARSVALVLHELLTNAVKYGALSNGRGRVRIDWSCDNHNCLLRWIEIDGPVVVTPTRLGFGSRMMKASLSQISGTIEPRFGPDGYSCVLTFRATFPKHSGKAATQKSPANTEPGLRAPGA
jgi:two-component sensor histidine kinase